MLGRCEQNLGWWKDVGRVCGGVGKMWVECVGVMGRCGLGFRRCWEDMTINRVHRDNWAAHLLGFLIKYGFLWEAK